MEHIYGDPTPVKDESTWDNGVENTINSETEVISGYPDFLSLHSRAAENDESDEEDPKAIMYRKLLEFDPMSDSHEFHVQDEWFEQANENHEEVNKEMKKKVKKDIKEEVKKTMSCEEKFALFKSEQQHIQEGQVPFSFEQDMVHDEMIGLWRCKRNCAQVKNETVQEWLAQNPTATSQIASQPRQSLAASTSRIPSRAPEFLRPIPPKNVSPPTKVVQFVSPKKLRKRAIPRRKPQKSTAPPFKGTFKCYRCGSSSKFNNYFSMKDYARKHVSSYHKVLKPMKFLCTYVWYDGYVVEAFNKYC